MVANYVEIRIKATDTAKPDLDELRADLDELGHKVDTAKIDVNDDDAKRKILEINAALAELNKKVANPKIDAAGAARAQARVEKLRQDLEDLAKQADNAPRGGYLGKILFGALGKLDGGGEGGSGSGGWLGLLGNLSGMAGGGGALAAGIGAILVELDGLVSGFAAAGAGAGAFALLAVPAFDKIKTAYTGITAAQQAYQKAQMTERMDPTKANAAAVAKALLNLREAYRGLDPAERGAVQGLQGFMGTFQRMSKAFEPQAFKVFNDGLKIANELLPQATPFANTFANAIGGLLKQAAGFFRVTTPVSNFARGVGLIGEKSKSTLTPFGEWLKQFHSLEGPSITAIGHGLGQVGIALGKLLTIMSKKDVVNAINIAFKVLTVTINALGWIIARVMLRWDQWQQLVRQVGHTAVQVGHDIEAVFDRVAGAVSRWASRVDHDVSQVIDVYRELPGRVMSAISSLPGRLFSAGAHAIEMLADGIRSAIGDVTGAIGSVISEITAHLPFSPAKKGPLSGRGDPVLAGRRITQYLATGMDSGVATVSAAADRVAGATMSHGRLTGGGHGGGIQLVVTPGARGIDALFITWLRGAIRTRGGLTKALGP